MNGDQPDRVLRLTKEAEGNYYQLVVLVGLSGTGKTLVLQELARRLDIQVINLNLAITSSMLELTERQRVLQLGRILDVVVEAQPGMICLLDNIEILFDPAMKHDPLRLLLELSREKTIAVAWNGTISEGHLLYAAPGHPEYQRYPVKDFLVATVEA
jgi:Cdc6-like AAA superfamily ATPase